MGPANVLIFPLKNDWNDLAITKVVNLSTYRYTDSSLQL